jgi:hypothetical protein
MVQQCTEMTSVGRRVVFPAGWCHHHQFKSTKDSNQIFFIDVKGYGMRRSRKALVKGRIVLGTEHRRLFVRGHIVRGHIVMVSCELEQCHRSPSMSIPFSTSSFSLSFILPSVSCSFFSLAYSTSLLNFMIANLQRSPFPRMATNVNALAAQNRFLLKDNWKKMFTVLPQDIPSPISEPV